MENIRYVVMEGLTRSGRARIVGVKLGVEHTDEGDVISMLSSLAPPEDRPVIQSGWNVRIEASDGYRGRLVTRHDRQDGLSRYHVVDFM